MKETSSVVNHTDLSPRHRLVLHTAHFFEPFRADLHELFSALGRQNNWSPDLKEIVSYTNRFWIGERSDSKKDQFTSEQEQAALAVLDRMGFRSEIAPQDGTKYNDIIIIGGTSETNYGRLAFVFDLIKNNGIRTDQITFWVGQRPRDHRDSTTDELLSQEGVFAGNNIENNPWVQYELKHVIPFDDETKLARLMAMKLIIGGENLKPDRIDLVVFNRMESNSRRCVEGRSPRLITDYRFTIPVEDSGGQISFIKFILLNAAAVPPDQGTTTKESTVAIPRDIQNARHTTASCAEEWCERHATSIDSQTPYRVLLVSGNPYTLRTAQDTLRVVQNMRRSTLHFDIAGPDTRNPSPLPALGEVARLLYNDLMINLS